jgi:hypothetical protein
MPNPYTTSTVDSPAYKQLITGRTDDIATFLDHIVQGHSIALFGERRIGKSSLLFLIRDIITGQVEHYRTNLVDLTLRSALDSLKGTVPSPSKAIHLNLQHVSKLEQEALVRMIHTALCDQGLLPAPLSGGSQLLLLSAPSAIPATIPEVFQALQAAPGNGRFVILFDEMECLQDFPDGEQIARNLRWAIESCPRICMVFAGAEGWYKQIKEKTSPLVHNVHAYYLKAPSRFPVETYLVKDLLSPFLPPGYESSAMVRTMMGWTQSKAFYVQAVCETIIERYGGRGQIPDNWQEEVKESVFESRGPVLRDFYAGHNLDALTKSILALLANRPGLTVKQVAERLGYPAKVIGEKMSDLVSLAKVSKQGTEEYRIVGTLIEAWGKQHMELPSMKSRWPQRIRWAAALVLIALAVGVYIYTHPGLQTFVFPMPGGTVTIQIPASLEQGETGNVVVSVQNTSAQKTATIHIFLSSPGIDYQLGGTNQLTFDGLAAGEKRTVQPIYTVGGADTPPSGMLTSQVLITQDHVAINVSRTFTITRRVLPLRQFWIPVSSLLAALGAFINGKDLWQLLAGLFSFLQGRAP